MKKKNTKPKVRNFVQMHVMEFNRPTVFKDKKKELKKGYQKHKGHFDENRKDFYVSENPFLLHVA